jgi:hypothetical protein
MYAKFNLLGTLNMALELNYKAFNYQLEGLTYTFRNQLPLFNYLCISKILLFKIFSLETKVVQAVLHKHCKYMTYHPFVYMVVAMTIMLYEGGGLMQRSEQK